MAATGLRVSPPKPQFGEEGGTDDSIRAIERDQGLFLGDGHEGRVQILVAARGGGEGADGGPDDGDGGRARRLGAQQEEQIGSNGELEQHLVEQEEAKPLQGLRRGGRRADDQHVVERLLVPLLEQTQLGGHDRRGVERLTIDDFIFY